MPGAENDFAIGIGEKNVVKNAPFILLIFQQQVISGGVFRRCFQL